MLWVLPESIRIETGRFRIWSFIRNAFGDANPNKAAVEMDKKLSSIFIIGVTMVSVPGDVSSGVGSSLSMIRIGEGCTCDPKKTFSNIGKKVPRVDAFAALQRIDGVWGLCNEISFWMSAQRPERKQLSKASRAWKIQSNGFEPSKFGRNIFGGRGWVCGGGGGGVGVAAGAVVGLGEGVS
nr:hypothetical protein [Tanacetum cinerariifolium]